MKQRKNIPWIITYMIALTVFAVSIHTSTAAADQPSADRPVEDGMYKLISGIHNGYVWDIHLASTEDGANLQLYEDNGSNAQKFDFTYVSDGYYAITNSNSGKAIGCFADELSDRVNLQQGSFVAADFQLWKLEPRESGYYSLICKGNGLAADAESGIAQNGTNLQAAQPNDAAAQEFRLIRTERKKDGSGSGRTVEHSRWFYDILTFLLIGVEAAVVLGAAYVFGRMQKKKQEAGDGKK